MGNSMFIYQHRGRSMGLEGKYYGLCPPLGTEPELQDFKLAITFEEEFCCCCSVANLCPTLCDPMDCSTPGSPVLLHLLEVLTLMSVESVMPSNHPILCHPLLLPPSIVPSIRVFSNESVLCTRWPKYWSFSFSISHSNEY